MIDEREGSRYVEVDQLTLHLHDIGNGPALVLLHGGGPGASGWSNFKQNVPTLSKHFRLLVIDLLGYGRSDKPEFGEPYYTMSARAVRGVLSVLGIEQAHFIGNSLGGGTAIRLALDYPECVGKLILMGPGGASPSLFTPEPTEGLKHLIHFYDEPGPSREKMRNIVSTMVFDDSFVTDELIQERYDAALAPGAREGTVRALTSIASTSDPDGVQLWRHFGRLDKPVLLVWGRDDRTIPLDGAFLGLRQMPDARLYVIPRCGHWAQLEHRDTFDRLAIDFLTQD